MIQSVRRVLATPLGYDPSNVISFRIVAEGPKYGAPADAAAFYRRILDAIHDVPGVDVAAVGTVACRSGVSNCEPKQLVLSWMGVVSGSN